MPHLIRTHENFIKVIFDDSLLHLVRIFYSKTMENILENSQNRLFHTLFVVLSDTVCILTDFWSLHVISIGANA